MTKEDKKIKDAELQKKVDVEQIITDIDKEFRELEGVGCFEEDLVESIQIDLIQVDEQAKEEAEEFLYALAVKFSGNIPAVQNDPYLKVRMREDANLLHELKYQMKFSKFATMKLGENILADQLYFRNYEMVKITQSSITEIARHLIQLQRLIEDYYRNYFLNVANYSESKSINNETTLSPSELIQTLEDMEG